MAESKTIKKKVSKKPKLKIQRNIIEIDAEGKVLGRLASEISKILTGKNKAIYQPHIDFGDTVMIKNIKKIKVTGKKMDQKIYYRHSTYPGGLKQEKLKDVMEKDATRVLKMAVRNMLPKNRLRKERLKRLKFV